MQKAWDGRAGKGLRAFITHPAVTAFFYVLALYVLAWRLYGIRYQTLDDAMYAYSASGFFTDMPVAPTVHVNVLYAAPITFLYEITRAVPWWPLALLGLTFCSCWCILTVFIKMCRDRGISAFLPLAVYTAVHFAAVWYFSVSLQWTYVSGICGGAACVLFCYIRRARFPFSALSTPSPKHTPWGLLSITAAFTFFCVTIRREGYVIVLPFFLIITVFDLVKTARRKLPFKGFIAVPLMFVLLLAATQIPDYAYRAGGELKTGYEFNIERQNYVDYPRPSYAQAPELYTSVGWSEELTVAVGEWFFMDRRVTTEALAAVNAGKGAYMQATAAETARRVLGEAGTLLTGSLYAWPFAALTCLSLAAAVIALKKRSLWAALRVAGVWLVNLLFALGLIYIGRYPPHVLFAVLVCAAAPAAYMLLECCADERRGEAGTAFENKVMGALSYALLATLCFHAVDVHTVAGDYYLQHNSLIQAARHSYAHEHPGNIYVGDGSFVTAHVNPAEVYPESVGRNMFYYNSTMLYSPYYNEQLAENGLDALYSEQFLDSNIRIVSARAPEAFGAAYFMNYMRATYGDVLAVPEDTVSVAEEGKAEEFIYIYRLETLN